MKTKKEKKIRTVHSHWQLLFILGFFFPFKILRDRNWNEEEASILVPGDIISIKLGDIIPADARLLDGDPLMIDQVFRYSLLQNYSTE